VDGPLRPDAFKELWLRFENEQGRFPLAPGERAWIEYSYSVSDRKWGNWFQRAVRLPTRHLAVRLDFRAQMEPVVWGTETTMTAESFPFQTAIERHDDDDRAVFSWSTHELPLHGRYRLEWRFEAPPASELPSGKDAVVVVVVAGSVLGSTRGTARAERNGLRRHSGLRRSNGTA
jgi:hypothetical protein